MREAGKVFKTIEHQLFLIVIFHLQLESLDKHCCDLANAGKTVFAQFARCRAFIAAFPIEK
jgi:hypothetical protein